MAITEDELTEFMEIWKREIGTEITRDQAASTARRIVDLYVALCRKLPSER